MPPCSHSKACTKQVSLAAAWARCGDTARCDLPGCCAPVADISLEEIRQMLQNSAIPQKDAYDWTSFGTPEAAQLAPVSAQAVRCCLSWNMAVLSPAVLVVLAVLTGQSSTRFESDLCVRARRGCGAVQHRCDSKEPDHDPLWLDAVPRLPQAIVNGLAGCFLAASKDSQSAASKRLVSTRLLAVLLGCCEDVCPATTQGHISFLVSVNSV